MVNMTKCESIKSIDVYGASVIYNICEFVMDLDSEVSNLPTSNQCSYDGRFSECGMGSTAFAINSSTAYMLNGQDQWKAI